MIGERSIYSFGIPDDKKIIDEQLEKIIFSKTDNSLVLVLIILKKKIVVTSYSFGITEKILLRSL